MMLYFLTTCFCMIALSFSRIQGWVSLIYLSGVFVVTFRLLRNIGAFSLDILETPVPTSKEDAASTQDDSP